MDAKDCIFTIMFLSLLKVALKLLYSKARPMVPRMMSRAANGGKRGKEMRLFHHYFKTMNLRLSDN